jgi:opine dehydrogenase
MRIAVIGAGNGGQAIAGYLGMQGHEVILYNRSLKKLQPVIANGGVFLKGAINGFGKIKLITDNMQNTINTAELIMVTTTADAHPDIANAMCQYLEDGQSIVLNPGRTCGAIEFYNVIKQNNLKIKVYIGEAQSLVFACRKEQEGIVNIIGVKNFVMFAAFPSINTDYMLNKLNRLFDCFIKAKNVLVTSLENVGAMFHPAIVLFNAATIDRKSDFYFYQDMSPGIASFLMELDKERLNIGSAFDIELTPVDKWIVRAYPLLADNSLCENMKNNPAYNNILGPQNLNSRLITEDIPTGLVPISELAKIVHIECSIMKAVIKICQTLVHRDFILTGRTLLRLGLNNMSKTDLLNLVY